MDRESLIREVAGVLREKGIFSGVPVQDRECGCGSVLIRRHSVGTAGKVFLNAPAAWTPFPKANPIRTEDAGRFHCPTCSPAEGLESLARLPAGPSHSIAAIFDHTLLDPAATRGRIEKLCSEAVKFSFATVCVNPFWVRACAALLSGTGVKVCAVAAFPFGSATRTVKAVEAGDAVANGAGEIDMVINIGALKSGDFGEVLEDIRAVRAVCSGKILKVIIEAALLTRGEKIKACRLAQEAGADFVKTSTGFATGGATVEDVALMRQTVGTALGVKASGGIRTMDDVLKLVRAGATRIGTSRSAAIMAEKMPAGSRSY